MFYYETKNTEELEVENYQAVLSDFDDMDKWTLEEMLALASMEAE